MSSDLSALVDEIRQASGAIERGDSAVNKRVDKLEDCVNELYRKTSRPGFGTSDSDAPTSSANPRSRCVVSGARSRSQRSTPVSPMTTHQAVPRSTRR
jgi:hypothetical protein